MLRIFIGQPNQVGERSNIHVINVFIETRQKEKIMIGDYAASWIPIAMVPFIGMVCFAVSMVLFFYYVEQEA